MAQEGNPRSPSGRRDQRRLRNFLLDRRFQLKYAGYAVAVALLLSVSLGVALYETSRAVLAQSGKTVRQGEQVLSRGREALEESRKVSAVVQMNIVKDPDYGSDPLLREAFSREAQAQDARLERRHRALVAQAEQLRQQARLLVQRQRATLTVLWLTLGLFVLLVALASVVVTHRIAGPVFKLRRHLLELGEGNLNDPGSLRRGDELGELFHVYGEALAKLRDRRRRQRELVQRVLADAGESASPALRELAEQLR
ncbi:MAG: methyl-accepting chemotaxis protein [Polyangiaceae bacterium]|nr:methyl-accepting chemotaxis protein [Polyangiaceae bacterium]